MRLLILSCFLMIVLAACAPAAATAEPTDIPPTQPPDDLATAATAESGVVYPEDPSQAGLAPYPDLLLDAAPTEPVPVMFVIQHRSALDGLEVTVRGYIVATLMGEKACPPNMGMCAAPSVFLADSTEPSRDPLTDLRVIVAESEVEADYPVGSVIEMRVTVSGSNVGLVAMKVY